MTFKERVIIGDKGLAASLGVWGLLGLATLALVLTIVASFVGEPDRGGPEGFLPPNFFPDGFPQQSQQIPFGIIGGDD